MYMNYIEKFVADLTDGPLFKEPTYPVQDLYNRFYGGYASRFEGEVFGDMEKVWLRKEMGAGNEPNGQSFVELISLGNSLMHKVEAAIQLSDHFEAMLEGDFEKNVLDLQNKLYEQHLTMKRLFDIKKEFSPVEAVYTYIENLAGVEEGCHEEAFGSAHRESIIGFAHSYNCHSIFGSSKTYIKETSYEFIFSFNIAAFIGDIMLGNWECTEDHYQLCLDMIEGWLNCRFVHDEDEKLKWCNGDSLENMGRRQLIQYIADNDLEIMPRKEYSDDELRDMIRGEEVNQ